MKCSRFFERNLCAVRISILSYFIVLVLLCQRIEGYPFKVNVKVGEYGKPDENVDYNKYVSNICKTYHQCKYGNDSSHLSPARKYCACDIECSKFDDCCIDAPKSDGIKSDMKCHRIDHIGGIFMVGKCPTTYKGDENWKELCENMEFADPSDPMGSVPVTDPDAGVTYKNIYCKLCNGKHHDMKVWQILLNCYSGEGLDIGSEEEIRSWKLKYPLENLVNINGTWGIYLEDDNGQYFTECKIDIFFPSDLKNKIRRCIPFLISDCPSSWKDETIRKQCKSYQGPLFPFGSFVTNDFRNPHCAVCNGADLSMLECLWSGVEEGGYIYYNF